MEADRIKVGRTGPSKRERMPGTTEEPGLERVARLACRFFDVSTVLIWMGMTEPDLVAETGSSLADVAFRTSFCAAVLQADDPILIEDAAGASEAGYGFVQEASGVRFCAGAPVMAPNGEPWGALALFDAEPREIQAEDESALRDWADTVASELERSRFRRRIEPPGADHAAESPRPDPALIASISQNISEGIFRSRPEQGLTYVNRACAELFGYDSTEALLSTHPRDLYADPERRDEVVRQLGQKGEIANVEAQFVRQDGSTFWGLLNGRVIYDEAGAVRYRDGVIIDISERKKAEEAWRESEERWQSLVENHPEGVFITVEGKFVYLNPAGAALLGAERPEEIVGRSVVEMVPDELRETIRERQAAVEQGEATPAQEQQVIGLDGRQRIIEVRSVPISYEGTIAAQTVARDVTERKRRAERLQAAESKFRGLVEQSLVGIYIMQSDRFIYVNPALAEMLGYTQEEMLSSLTPMDPVYEDDRARVVSNIGERLEGDLKDVRYTFRMRRKDGEVIWVEAHGTRTEHEGEPAIIGTILDVTARHEWEQQLITAKEEAETAREKAEEMSRLKSAFLANMSHEIRTPLTSIIGFAELIGEDPEVALEFSALIRESGQRLLQTLNSVLDLAQLEAGSLELQPEPLDLGKEAKMVLDQFRPQAHQKDITLQFEAPPGPVMAMLDRAALSRILSNLVSNAVKFTEEGYVAVRVRVKEPCAEIEIEDTGIGIGEGFLEYLFEEFRQESAGEERTHEGSGLGLTITRRLVELMGGSIDVESASGEGSTFTVQVPRPPSH